MTPHEAAGGAARAADAAPEAGAATARAALVTGGSRGIGRAVVEEFAAAGMQVAFTYVSDDRSAEELVARLRPAAVQAFKADVRCAQSAATVVKGVVAAFGRLDVLVNNAGVRRDGYLATSAAERWHEVIDTNLTGVFNYSRAVLLGMLKRGSGHIVNVTSLSGIVGLAGQANYSAAKAGLIGLTKALAKEVASRGVRVNAVAPGLIATDMTADLGGRWLEATTARIPLARAGCPAEVARLIRFLVSEDAGYITGQVIRIDGGLES